MAAVNNPYYSIRAFYRTRLRTCSYATAGHRQFKVIYVANYNGSFAYNYPYNALPPPSYEP